MQAYRSEGGSEPVYEETITRGATPVRERADIPGTRTPRLRCDECGLRYAAGAIARQPALAEGTTCRRCGGTLRLQEADARAEPLLYERSAPATPSSIGAARRGLHRVLTHLGVAGPLRADIALAVSEAATNAVVHAYRGEAPGPLEVRATLAAGALVVTVGDQGRGMRRRPGGPALGLGVPLMGALSDELRIRPGDGGLGVQVSLRFRDVLPA